MRLDVCLLLTAAAIALTSCGGGSVSEKSASAGDLVSDPVHVDSADVDSATIGLKMGVGDLDVSGGAATGVVDGKLEYNVPSWKPKVSQSKDGRAARLSIEQPSSTHTSGDHAQNHWTLQVGNSTPVTFDIACGVGDAKLKLGGLKLRGVTLNVGVGKIDLDLRGHPDQDYSVKVQGGVGEATIYVPAEASVRAKAQSGLVPVEVEGLVKRGDTWESPDFGKVKPTIELDVQGGVGQIRVVR
jgi:hypothetical protein